MDQAGGATLHYLGWSGFRIAVPGGGSVLIDPPADVAMDGSDPVHLLLSHGHPEHVAGARTYLEHEVDGPVTTVIASPAVCRHLERQTRRRSVTFQPVLAGACVALGGGRSVEAFRWRHLPLLPPGLGAALRHVARLASRPGLAARIALAGLAGSPVGEMLGFRLDLGERVIVAYGEGLHRRCLAAEAAAQCGGASDVLLLVAVEPEDEAALPGLLRSAGVTASILYEPHAGWRDAFGMKRADLGSLCRAMEAVGVRAVTATPGMDLRLIDAAVQQT